MALLGRCITSCLTELEERGARNLSSAGVPICSRKVHSFGLIFALKRARGRSFLVFFFVLVVACFFCFFFKDASIRFIRGILLWFRFFWEVFHLAYFLVPTFHPFLFFCLQYLYRGSN